MNHLSSKSSWISILGWPFHVHRTGLITSIIYPARLAGCLLFVICFIDFVFSWISPYFCSGFIYPSFKENPAYKKIIEFEFTMKSVHHKKCDVCLCVSLNIQVHKTRSDGKFRCLSCKQHSRQDSSKPLSHLPIWYDNNNNIMFHLPDELLGLQEGEKLLI